MDATAGIGFLLIADLHIGNPHCRLTWPEYRDELERDLRREHFETGPWDLLLIAGGVFAEPGGHDRAGAELLDGVYRFIRSLGSAPTLAIAQSGTESVHLSGASATHLGNPPSSMTLTRSGVTASVVSLLSPELADVADQLALVDARTPRWRDADARVLLTRHAGPASDWTAAARLFDLHCAAAGSPCVETAIHHARARSLLGAVGVGDEPRYGYVSGRMDTTGIRLRHRAMQEGGAHPLFVADPALGRALPVLTVGTRLVDGRDPAPLVKMVGTAGIEGRIGAPPRWNPKTARLLIEFRALDGATRQLDVDPIAGGAVRLLPPDAVVDLRSRQSSPTTSLVASDAPTQPYQAASPVVPSQTPTGLVVVDGMQTALRRSDGSQTVLLANAAATSVAYLSDVRQIVVASDNDLVIVDEAGELVRTVSAHDDPCVGITANAKGNLAASISVRGEVAVWRTADWAELARWSFDEGTASSESIQFSPHDNRLAVCRPTAVEVHEIDPAILHAQARPNATSVTAKVVVVGRGRVGKTCLAERLVHDRYCEHASTHGMRFWPRSLLPARGIGRELVLWDLGGQSEYRLLHQLFLPDTQLALILVEPETEAYADAREWSARLDNAGVTTKILVGTKVDSDDAAVNHGALQRLARDCGCVATVLTSARTGTGRVALLAAIEAHIDWGRLSADTRGRAAQWLARQFATLRDAGRVVVAPAQLSAELPADIDGADLLTATRQLARRGAIANTRTATGEHVVVLRIEEIERYAGSLIVAAQQHPAGIAALDAGALLADRMSFPRIAAGERLPRAEEFVVLDCVVEMLVQQGLALLHHGQLVFPSLLQTGGDEPPPPRAHVRFEFDGAVDRAYASLVTDLALAEAYGPPRLSRHAARFSRASLGTCGIRRIEPTLTTRGGLDVFFEDDPETATEHAFVCYVEDHLHRNGVDVRGRPQTACHACAHPFDSAVLEKRLEAGHDDVLCPVCEARTRIVAGPNRARAADSGVDARNHEQREAARAARSQSAATVKRIVEAGAHRSRPRWVLVLSDLHVGTDSDIATMRQTLLEDLRSPASPQPEQYAALVICGDLTNRATPAEFERALELIGSLVASLEGVSAEQTIIVPGNHDLDWSHPGVYRPHVGPDPSAGLVQVDGAAMVRDEEAYRLSFANFSAGIYETFYQRPYAMDPAQQFDVFDLPDAGLTFATFNSAWNTAKHSPHAATIRDDAVGAALERLARSPSGHRKIAVWHHPITGNEKIARDAFVQRMRGAGISLCLHGHVHESRADLVGYLHPQRLHAIGTGSFGAPSHDRAESTPRLYHLLELSDDRGSIRVHTRQLAREGGAWEPFYDWPDPRDPGKRLPHYDIVFEI